MNDPRAQRRRQRRNPRAPEGRHQRDTKAGFSDTNMETKGKQNLYQTQHDQKCDLKILREKKALHQ